MGHEGGLLDPNVNTHNQNSVPLSLGLSVINRSILTKTPQEGQDPSISINITLPEKFIHFILQHVQHIFG